MISLSAIADLLAPSYRSGRDLEIDDPLDNGGPLHVEGRMKRIVDGRTYNTETSTLLAKAEWVKADMPHQGADCEGALYQTLGGRRPVFFVTLALDLLLFAV